MVRKFYWSNLLLLFSIEKKESVVKIFNHLKDWFDGLKFPILYVVCISFPIEPLISRTFLDHYFCHHFWVGLLLLCCCSHPKVATKMAKKCSTNQRFIRKRNTTYKIYTLASKITGKSDQEIWWLKLFDKNMDNPT